MTQEETKDYYDLTHPDKPKSKILCQTDGIPHLDHTNPDGSRCYIDEDGLLNFTPPPEPDSTLEEEIEKLNRLLAESPFDSIIAAMTPDGLKYLHKKHWYNNPNWWKIWNPESSTPGGWIVIGIISLGLFALALYGEFGGF